MSTLLARELFGDAISDFHIPLCTLAAAMPGAQYTFMELAQFERLANPRNLRQRHYRLAKLVADPLGRKNAFP
jgi:hypothetical protein